MDRVTCREHRAANGVLVGVDAGVQQQWFNGSCNGVSRNVSGGDNPDDPRIAGVGVGGRSWWGGAQSGAEVSSCGRRRPRRRAVLKGAPSLQFLQPVSDLCERAILVLLGGRDCRGGVRWGCESRDESLLVSIQSGSVGSLGSACREAIIRSPSVCVVTPTPL